MKKNSLFGSFLLLIASFIWGTAFVAQSVAMDHLGPFTFGGVRYLLSFFTVLPIAIYTSKKRSEIKITKRSAIGGTLCGVFLFAGATFQQFGILYSTVSKAGFITTLYIVIVPIISAFVFKNKVAKKTVIAVIIAVVGFYLLTMSSQFVISLGDVLLFIGSIFWALQIITIDRVVRHEDPLVLLIIEFSVTSILSFVFALLFESITISSIVNAIGPILYAGILSGGIAFSFQMFGQRTTEPVIASLIMSLESVFASLGGVILLSEVLSTKEIIGCILIFVAIILAQVKIKKKKPT
ncbi:MAG: EamA family transporter [Clostridiales bacterium]|nr:MAG: EamA family transporter [Clostridiales bacterium]